MLGSWLNGLIWDTHPFDLVDGFEYSLSMFLMQFSIIPSYFSKIASDDEWKEIIPAAGLRKYIREQLQKIIEEEKKVVVSQLY